MSSEGHHKVAGWVSQGYAWAVPAVAVLQIERRRIWATRELFPPGEITGSTTRARDESGGSCLKLAELRGPVKEDIHDYTPFKLGSTSGSRN